MRMVITSNPNNDDKSTASVLAGWLAKQSQISMNPHNSNSLIPNAAHTRTKSKKQAA